MLADDADLGAFKAAFDRGSSGQDSDLLYSLRIIRCTVNVFIGKTGSGQCMGGKVDAVDMQVVVGKDLAIIQNYEKGENKGEDGKVLTVLIRATNIFRKEEGQWKMISHHTDLLPHLNK